MKRHSSKRRFLCFVMSLVMVVGFGMGANVFADGTDASQDDTTTVTDQSATGTDDSATDENTDAEKDEAVSTDTVKSSTKGASLKEQTSGDNKLNVKVTNDSGVFVDVDTIGNAITWPMSTKTKQMQITADFADVGIAQDRTITVNVPEGYKIKEYTIKSGTSVPSGATGLDLSSENDAKVQSSVLTATDGSAWADQKISGYTANGTETETDAKTYGGKVTYKFNSNCDKITLTLTLELQQEILSHAASTYVMDPITVDMKNGSASLDTDLTTTVSELVVPQLYGGYSLPVEVNDDGSTPTFSTTFNYIQKSSTSEQTSVLNSNYTATFDYPEGATFVGFEEETTGVSKPTSTSYNEGHLVVTDDPLNKKVTFTYTDVTLKDSGGAPFVTLYWKAEVDGTTVKYDTEYQADASSKSTFVDGSAVSNTATMSVVYQKKGYVLYTKANNLSRSDLNNQDDFPYTYMLGGWDVQNVGPSVAENLTVEQTFDANLQVQAVCVPTVAGISNIKATTNKGTKTLAGPLTDGKIQAEDLGLDDDEYITAITYDLDKLEVNNYTNGYTSASSFQYYGKFKDGNEGDATLAIYDDQGALVSSSTGVSLIPTVVTDHTTIAWSNTGVANVITEVKKDDGSVGSFYPNDTMNFTSAIQAGSIIRTQDEIVDPEVIISLPKGINLDTTSVKATSEAGNYGTDSFPLTIKSMQTITIDGVEWTVYTFKASNHQDMIAQALNQGGDNLESMTMKVEFKATVRSDCQAYGQLDVKDLVQWDCGQTVIGAGTVDVAIANTDGKASGKATTYNLAADPTGNTQVVQKPGLTVNLGIRTVGSSDDFYNYDGTDATIAPVSPTDNAEIEISYENTSDSAYKTGSEIYLPIPKKNGAFSSYFNNAEISDPINNDDFKQNEWTGILDEEITLPRFDTYYGVGINTTTNGGTVTNTWVPVSGGTWYTSEAALTGDGYTLADVNMVKFVANQDLSSGVKDSTTFEMAIDSTATLGETDYWRSYQKGWLDTTGAGTWTYGGVVAAEPGKAGVKGMIFNDLNANGTKDAGEDYANTGGTKVTALLTEKDGKITPLNMTMNADGSFESLNSDGTPYYLKAGEYTVTITNTDTDVTLSPISSSTASDGTTNTWNMNLAQADIATNQMSGTYTFTVAPGTSLVTEYVGVGLKDSVQITYAAGAHGSIGTPASEKVGYGNSAANVPTASPDAGYTASGWVLNKDVTATANVTLADGTVITAGSTIAAGKVFANKTELQKAIINEDVTATAQFSPKTDTQYKVEHYTQKLDGTYELKDTENKTGTTDTTVNATVKTYTGFSENTTIASRVPSGTVQGDGTLVLKLYYDRTKVAVTYNGNGNTGGTAPTDSSSPYMYEDTATVLGNTGSLTKTGFTFSGWNTAANGTGTSYAAGASVTIGTSPVTLYAQYTANGNTAYTVEHYTQKTDGTYELKDTENKTGTTDTTATATAKSYTGFSENTTIASRVPSGTIKGDGSLVLKLYYDRTKSAVTYDGNGNTGGTAPTDSSSPYMYEATVTVLGNTGSLTKTGFTFSGWNTLANGTGTSYAAGATFAMGTTEVKLYAQYTANGNTAYMVEHYTQKLDGTYELKDTENKTGTTDTTATATAKSYTGFSENTTIASRVPSGNINGDGSLVLKLYYDRTKSAVTYNGNGNTGGTAPTDSSSPYMYGDTATVLGNTGSLVKTGWHFSGWNTAANGTGTAYAAGDSVSIGTSPVALYAQYAPNTDTAYTVEHYTEKLDGTYELKDTDNKTGTTETPATAVAKTYKGFTENTTIASRVPTGTIQADGSLVLKLYYDRDEIKVVYDGNGNDSGTVPTDASNPYLYQDTVTVLGNTGNLAKTGYDFTGWNTKADGSGTAYAPASTFTAEVDAAGAAVPMTLTNDTITLYAQYTKQTYTVAFNSNGGNYTPSSQSIQYGDKITEPKAPTKTGSKFLGWYYKNASGQLVKWNFGDPVTGPITLIAQWSKINSAGTVTGMDKSANTGDDSAAMAGLALMLTGLGAVVVLARRRRNS